MCHFKKSDWPIVTCAAIFAVLLLGVGQPVQFISIFLLGLVLLIPVVFGLFIPSLLQSYSQGFLNDWCKHGSDITAIVVFVIAQVVLFLVFQLIGLSSNLGFFSGLLWLFIVTLLSYSAFYLFCRKCSEIKSRFCKLGLLTVSQCVIAFCFFFSVGVLQSHFMIETPAVLLAFLIIAVSVLSYSKNRGYVGKSMVLIVSYVLILGLLSLFRSEDMEQQHKMTEAGLHVPEVIAAPKAVTTSEKKEAPEKKDVSQ